MIITGGDSQICYYGPNINSRAIGEALIKCDTISFSHGSIGTTGIEFDFSNPESLDYGMRPRDIDVVLSRILQGCLDFVYGEYSLDIMLCLLKNSFVFYGDVFDAPVLNYSNYSKPLFKIDHLEDVEGILSEDAMSIAKYILEHVNVKFGSWYSRVYYRLCVIIDDYLVNEEFDMLCEFVYLLVDRPSTSLILQDGEGPNAEQARLGYFLQNLMEKYHNKRG